MSSSAAAATGITQPTGGVSDDEEEDDFSTADTYASYIPAKVKIGRPHPDSVVESSSLSSVEPPDVTFDLKLPQAVVRAGKLSSLQLESVIYASQKHTSMLPDGTRAGFLVGDGAGVGKGRIIAGMIYQNYLEGRKQAVWLSVSNDLKLDAARDLKDLGAKIDVYSLNKFQYGPINSTKNGNVEEGVIFATYSSLIGESRSGGQKKTRFDQLVNWLGANFDGIIVFDECHKAKNLVPASVKKNSGSKTGLTVLRLQSDLPKARVVYCSATGASEPRNMAYMSRLGIWGTGTEFDNFAKFIEAVERRGVGAMELVAIDMKLRGMYIARQLSFAGVTFTTEKVELTDDFMVVYDAAASLWVEAKRLFQEAVDIVDQYCKQRWKTLWSQFWASHQRFFKYMCIAAKVPRAIALSKKALEEGKCVVVGLQSTGEARTLEQLEQCSGEVDDFFSTIKGVLETLIHRHFPSFGDTPKTTSKTSELPGMSSDEEDWTSDTPDSVDLLSSEEEEDEEELEFKNEDSDEEEWKPLRDGLRKRTAAKSSSTLAPKKKKAGPKAPSIQRNGRAKAPPTARKGRAKATVKVEKTEAPFSRKKRPPTSRSSRKENSNAAFNSKKIKVEGVKVEEMASSPERMPTPPPPHHHCKATPSGRGGAADPAVLDKADLVDAMGAQYVVTVPPKVKAGEATAVYTVTKMKEELLRRLDLLDAHLPKNTLDKLVDGLGGTKCVAEMTGRRGRMVTLPEGGVEYQVRSERDVPTDLLNIREKERFMDGEKDVAIISEAASCGISLQADRRAKNRKRRVHITLELPWSADRAIQQFGRTHRSNQTSAPEYIFLISALAGEQRFASIVAKRLQSLGALTHGDRRASDSRDLSKYNVDTKYGRKALDKTLHSILEEELPIVRMDAYPRDFFQECQHKLTGVGLFKPITSTRRKKQRKPPPPRGNWRRGYAFQPVEPEPEPVIGRVGMEKDGVPMSQFLNRILGLPVKLQNKLFSYFLETLAAIVECAKREGHWDGGILDFGCSEEHVQIVKTEDFSAANIASTQLYTIEVERGVSYEEALEKLDTDTRPGEGFYISKKVSNDKKLAVLLKASSTSSRYFSVYRPSIGKLHRMERLVDVVSKHTLAEEEEEIEEARKWWITQYEASLDTCCHAFWGSCGRKDCIAGMRQRTFYMLGGSVLGVWSHIEAVFSGLPEKNQRIQIIRVKTKTKRLVGILVPKASVDNIRKTLSKVLHKGGHSGHHYSGCHSDDLY